MADDANDDDDDDGDGEDSGDIEMQITRELASLKKKPKRTAKRFGIVS
jgi:hypothetical protein